MKTLLTAAVILSACQSHKAVNHVDGDLLLKKEVYCTLGEDIRTEKGYFGDKCDALLFTALHDVSCGTIDLSNFHDAEGKFYRSPSHDCFPDESKSSISRDMLLGAMIAAHIAKDKSAIDAMIKYGESHNWIMGDYANEDGLSRVVMSPQLISILYDIQKGASAKLQSSDDVFVLNKGFEAHLDVLRILLKGNLYGEISAIDLSILKAQSERVPSNALFQAAYHKYLGDNQTVAIALLKSAEYHPENALPTTENRCSGYIYQRDFGDDWKPCAGNRTHDGTDFLITYAVVTGIL